MNATRTMRDRVRGLFLDNFWLKAFSLVCSIGLWAYIHGAESVQRTLDVDVVRLPPPADRHLLSDVPAKVTLLLRGPKTQVEELKQGEVGPLQLDFRSGRGSRIDLDAASLRLPAGVTVDQMFPSMIELRWDDIVSKEIPLQVSRIGEPAQGFTIKGAVHVEPPSISVRGPRSMLNVMQVVRTAPFDIGGLTGGEHKRQLALDRAPTPVSYDVESAWATVDIARAVVPRDLQKLKVQVVGLLRASTQPPTVLVRIKGTSEDVSSVDVESVVARVEPKAAGLDVSKPGNAYLDVLVDIPRVSIEVVPAKVYVQW